MVYIKLLYPNAALSIISQNILMLSHSCILCVCMYLEEYTLLDAVTLLLPARSIEKRPVIGSQGHWSRGDPGDTGLLQS